MLKTSHATSDGKADTLTPSAPVNKNNAKHYIHNYRHQLINTLWPGDAIWRHRTGSISTHLMAFT